jgi:hypothetical protein
MSTDSIRDYKPDCQSAERRGHWPLLRRRCHLPRHRTQPRRPRVQHSHRTLLAGRETGRVRSRSEVSRGVSLSAHAQGKGSGAAHRPQRSERCLRRGRERDSHTRVSETTDESDRTTDRGARGTAARAGGTRTRAWRERRQTREPHMPKSETEGLISKSFTLLVPSVVVQAVHVYRHNSLHPADRTPHGSHLRFRFGFARVTV